MAADLTEGASLAHRMEMNATRMQLTLDEIYRKYDREFPNDDIIELQDFQLKLDNGILKSMSEVKLGHTALVGYEDLSRHDSPSSCSLDDSFSRGSPESEKTFISVNCSRWIADVMAEESEPSDAETITSSSEGEEDSWEDEETEEIPASASDETDSSADWFLSDRNLPEDAGRWLTLEEKERLTKHRRAERVRQSNHPSPSGMTGAHRPAPSYTTAYDLYSAKRKSPVKSPRRKHHHRRHSSMEQPLLETSHRLGQSTYHSASYKPGRQISSKRSPRDRFSSMTWRRSRSGHKSGRREQSDDRRDHHHHPHHHRSMNRSEHRDLRSSTPNPLRSEHRTSSSRWDNDFQPRSEHSPDKQAIDDHGPAAEYRQRRSPQRHSQTPRRRQKGRERLYPAGWEEEKEKGRYEGSRGRRHGDASQRLQGQSSCQSRVPLCMVPPRRVEPTQFFPFAPGEDGSSGGDWEGQTPESLTEGEAEKVEGQDQQPEQSRFQRARVASPSTGVQSVIDLTSPAVSPGQGVPSGLNFAAAAPLLENGQQPEINLDCFTTSPGNEAKSGLRLTSSPVFLVDEEVQAGMDSRCSMASLRNGLPPGGIAAGCSRTSPEEEEQSRKRSSYSATLPTIEAQTGANPRSHFSSLDKEVHMSAMPECRIFSFADEAPSGMKAWPSCTESMDKEVQTGMISLISGLRFRRTIISPNNEPENGDSHSVTSLEKGTQSRSQSIQFISASNMENNRGENRRFSLCSPDKQLPSDVRNQYPVSSSNKPWRSETTTSRNSATSPNKEAQSGMKLRPQILSPGEEAQSDASSKGFLVSPNKEAWLGREVEPGIKSANILSSPSKNSGLKPRCLFTSPGTAPQQGARSRCPRISPNKEVQSEAKSHDSCDKKLPGRIRLSADRSASKKHAPERDPTQSEKTRTPELLSPLQELKEKLANLSRSLTPGKPSSEGRFEDREVDLHEAKDEKSTPRHDWFSVKDMTYIVPRNSPRPVFQVESQTMSLHVQSSPPRTLKHGETLHASGTSQSSCVQKRKEKSYLKHEDSFRAPNTSQLSAVSSLANTSSGPLTSPLPLAKIRSPQQLQKVRQRFRPTFKPLSQTEIMSVLNEPNQESFIKFLSHTYYKAERSEDDGAAKTGQLDSSAGVAEDCSHPCCTGVAGTEKKRHERQHSLVGPAHEPLSTSAGDANDDSLQGACCKNRSSLGAQYSSIRATFMGISVNKDSVKPTSGAMDCFIQRTLQRQGLSSVHRDSLREADADGDGTGSGCRQCLPFSKTKERQNSRVVGQDSRIKSQDSRTTGQDSGIRDQDSRIRGRDSSTEETRLSCRMYRATPGEMFRQSIMASSRRQASRKARERFQLLTAAAESSSSPHVCCDAAHSKQKTGQDGFGADSHPTSDLPALSNSHRKPLHRSILMPADCVMEKGKLSLDSLGTQTGLTSSPVSLVGKVSPSVSLPSLASSPSAACKQQRPSGLAIQHIFTQLKRSNETKNEQTRRSEDKRNHPSHHANHVSLATTSKTDNTCSSGLHGDRTSAVNRRKDCAHRRVCGKAGGSVCGERMDREERRSQSPVQNWSRRSREEGRQTLRRGASALNTLSDYEDNVDDILHHSEGHSEVGNIAKLTNTAQVVTSSDRRDQSEKHRCDTLPPKSRAPLTDSVREVGGRLNYFPRDASCMSRLATEAADLSPSSRAQGTPESCRRAGIQSSECGPLPATTENHPCQSSDSLTPSKLISTLSLGDRQSPLGVRKNFSRLLLSTPPDKLSKGEGLQPTQPDSGGRSCSPARFDSSRPRYPQGQSRTRLFTEQRETTAADGGQGTPEMQRKRSLLLPRDGESGTICDLQGSVMSAASGESWKLPLSGPASLRSMPPAERGFSRPVRRSNSKLVHISSPQRCYAGQETASVTGQKAASLLGHKTSASTASPLTAEKTSLFSFTSQQTSSFTFSPSSHSRPSITQIPPTKRRYEKKADETDMLASGYVSPDDSASKKRRVSIHGTSTPRKAKRSNLEFLDMDHSLSTIQGEMSGMNETLQSNEQSCPFDALSDSESEDEITLISE